MAVPDAPEIDRETMRRVLLPPPGAGLARLPLAARLQGLSHQGGSAALRREAAEAARYEIAATRGPSPAAKSAANAGTPPPLPVRVALPLPTWLSARETTLVRAAITCGVEDQGLSLVSRRRRMMEEVATHMRRHVIHPLLLTWVGAMWIWVSLMVINQHGGPFTILDQMLGGERLPTITIVMRWINNLIYDHPVCMAVLLGSTGIALGVAYAATWFKHDWSLLLSRYVKGGGSVRRLMDHSLLCYLLASAMRRNVPLGEALTSAATGMRHGVLRRSLTYAAELIAIGGGSAGVLSENGDRWMAIDPHFCACFDYEEPYRIADALESLASAYDGFGERTPLYLARLPISLVYILVMGFGFLYFSSFYLVMFRMVDSLGGG